MIIAMPILLTILAAAVQVTALFAALGFGYLVPNSWKSNYVLIPIGSVLLAMGSMGLMLFAGSYL